MDRSDYVSREEKEETFVCGKKMLFRKLLGIQTGAEPFKLCLSKKCFNDFKYAYYSFLLIFYTSLC